ncbi:hypothetical protein V5799_023147, partial [Amblyomma americanum]
MLGYCVILSGCVVVEACISWVSMRGSILDAAPRASMQYLLYVRLGTPLPVRETLYLNSFAEIAKLLSDFFRDLDVVPSDVVAGLVLLRKFQRQERLVIVSQNVCEAVMVITHYMHYALGVYGWPMYMMTRGSTGCCQLFPSLRCCCIPTRKKKRDRALVVEDNCCYCNYAALRHMVNNHNMEVVYVTYHVD